MMSKELRAFRKICKNLNSYEFTDEYKKNKELIETALNEKVNIENRIDEIFENHNIKSFTELNERLCDYNELKFDDDIKQKKLKALEVIKSSCEFDFIESSVNEKTTYEIHIRPKNKEQLLFNCLAIFLKTKEEFDLLKEVLL